MRTAGISVPGAVREIVTRNRAIQDCMKMGVINYTALAARIRPEIERLLGNPVNLNTVVVAIKRYADALGVGGSGRGADAGAEAALKNARLVLTDGMIDVRFSAKEFDRMGPAEILERFARMGGDYEFFRLSDSLRFLVEDMQGVREIFRDMQGAGGEEICNTGLAKIRVLMPDAQGPPSATSDVVSHVVEVLHMAGIEIVNAYFGQDSITIIVREEDAARAYDALSSYTMRR